MSYRLVRRGCLLAALLGVSATATPQDYSFSIRETQSPEPAGPDGATIVGEAGSSVVKDYSVILNANRAAVNGWMLSLVPGGAVEITDLMFRGTEADIWQNPEIEDVFGATTCSAHETGASMEIHSLSGSPLPVGETEVARVRVRLDFPAAGAAEGSILFVDGCDAVPVAANAVLTSESPCFASDGCVSTTDYRVTLETTTSAAHIIRGDCNGDGKLNIADALCTLNWLFLGEDDPPCIAALNTNGEDQVNLTDAVHVLNFLFLGGPPPVDPFPGCGTSVLETDQELGCATPPKNCQQ